MINHILKALMIIMVSTLFLNGCATTQNLLTTGNYSKQTVPNPQTYFRQIWAVEDDGKLRVSGRLHVNGARMYVPGYVEVALMDEDLRITEKQKVAYSPKVFTNRKIRRRGAKFIAEFSEAPPPGTIIRLSNVN